MCVECFCLSWVLFSQVKDVTMDMREGLAASIVSQYPKFKDVTDSKKKSWVGICFVLTLSPA